MNKKTGKVKAKGHRGRHGGSVFLNGKYYSAQWMVNGKRFYRNTHETDKAEAEKRLTEYLATTTLADEKAALEMLAGQIAARDAEITAIEKAEEESAAALSLADAWEAYERSPKRSRKAGPAAMEVLRCTFGCFVGWMKDRHPETTELRGVSQEVANGFFAWLEKNRSAGTVNKYLNLLARVWDVLGETARVKENPWLPANIRRLPNKMFSRRELTVDELREVCGKVSGEMRTLFAIGIYTGLRLGDAVLLDWGAVDLARGFITLVPRKTETRGGKVVHIPLHNALRGILCETPSSKRRGRVVPGLAARYLSPGRRDGVSKEIQEIFKGCGIETTTKSTGRCRASVKVGFHSLRHTFVSLCANGGVSLALVQSIVGHSSPVMTAHYFHESDEALRGAVAVLPSVIDGEEIERDETKADEGKLADFRALVSGFNAEERKAAIRILQSLEA